MQMLILTIRVDKKASFKGFVVLYLFIIKTKIQVYLKQTHLCVRLINKQTSNIYYKVIRISADFNNQKKKNLNFNHIKLIQ